MLAGKPPRLPREYQEVEYLESTGTQFIQTGLSVAVEDEIETKSSTNQSGSYRTVIATQGMFELYYQIPTARMWIGGSGTAIIESGKTNNILLGETCIHRCRLTRVGIENTNLELFSYARSYNLNGKIFYVTWYRDGAVIHSFIPCYRKSDHKPGMYDIVSKTLFTNAGTGEFLVGPDVN